VVRIAALGGALLGLAACGTSDGTYLVTTVLKQDSCTPDNPSIGQEVQMMASLYHTTGGMAMDVSGMLLVGDNAKGGDFRLSQESGESVSIDGCDELTSNAVYALDASFTKDLGFEGSLSSKQDSNRVNCPDTVQESCEQKFHVSAMHLNASSSLRPTGTVNWGYFQGGGY
jgi:hypothetical protein